MKLIPWPEVGDDIIFCEQVDVASFPERKGKVIEVADAEDGGLMTYATEHGVKFEGYATEMYWDEDSERWDAR